MSNWSVEEINRLLESDTMNFFDVSFQLRQQVPLLRLVEAMLATRRTTTRKALDTVIHLKTAEQIGKGVKAVPLLIEALHHRSPIVRSMAANTLGNIGDQRACDPLMHRLKVEYDLGIKGTIITGLAGCLCFEAIPQIDDVLKQSKSIPNGEISVMAWGSHGYLKSQLERRKLFAEVGPITMVDRLTPEQIAQAQQFARRWLKRTLNANPTDRGMVERSAAALYRAAGRVVPKFVWYASPADYKRKVRMSSTAQRAGIWWEQSTKLALAYNLQMSEAAQQQVSEVFGSVFVGPAALSYKEGWLIGNGANCLAISLVLPYVFAERYLGVRFRRESCACRDLWIKIYLNCWAMTDYEDRCIFIERPSILELDRQLRLHSTDGPAIAFRDGTEGWCLHDMKVDPKIARANRKAQRTNRRSLRLRVSAVQLSR